MFSQRRLYVRLLLIAVMAFVFTAGCSAEENDAGDEPDTGDVSSMPEPVDKPAADHDHFEPVSSIEPMVGTWWSRLGGAYWMFTDDGVVATDTELVSLSSSPAIIGEYGFDGDEMCMTFREVVWEQGEEAEESLLTGPVTGKTNCFTVAATDGGNLVFTATSMENDFFGTALSGDQGLVMEWEPVD